MPERLELLEQRDQVLEISSEPIKAPAHEHIESSSCRVSNDVREAGAVWVRSMLIAIDLLCSKSVPAIVPNHVQ